MVDDNYDPGGPKFGGERTFYGQHREDVVALAGQARSHAQKRTTSAVEIRNAMNKQYSHWTIPDAHFSAQRDFSTRAVMRKDTFFFSGVSIWL
jgi:hypothetical protein